MIGEEGHDTPSGTDVSNGAGDETVQLTIQLVHFLEQHPNAQQTIDQILQAHLRRPATTETASNLYDSLAIYMGEDLANFLLLLLAQAMSSPAVLEPIESHLDGEQREWVRSLLARHGTVAREIYIIGGETPDAWRTVNRQAYFDLMSGRWRILFEIVKYNGERTTYEETPNTLLILADAILDTLNRLPSDVAPQLIEPERMESFINSCTSFLQLYAPEVFGQEAQTAQADDADDGR
ncbi:MAG: hypothetical protein Kow0047_11250 [Anaerolineae bacterium]